MRLLYTLTSYPPSMGGAQLHQHLLARQLQQTHSIQVASHWDVNRTDWLLGTTLRARNLSLDYKIDGIEVHLLSLSFAEKLKILPSLLAYYPWMRQAVKPIAAILENHLNPFMNEVDLVHNVRIGREPLSIASYQLARRHKVPFVFTPVHHPRWTGWLYRVYQDLYKATDLLIALTNKEKELLVSFGVPESRIAVTGMGPVLSEKADASSFLAAHQIQTPFILFLGQHYSYKGYQQLLESSHLVWKNFPDTHFVFIGPDVGSSPSVFEKYIDPRIHRLGPVSLQTKTDALAACALLCVPSTQESFGGVYAEAWSFGKPVIGCSIPAVQEVIADGVDGYLVEQNPQQIAERICFLLDHPTQAQQMGERGRVKVEERYTWKRIADLTNQAYLKLKS